MVNYTFLVIIHTMHKCKGEMAILDVEWCDFVVFSKGEVVVDRILADLDYWNDLEEKLE